MLERYKREMNVGNNLGEQRGNRWRAKTLRGARMIVKLLIIVIATVLLYNAYLIWYAKSGRFAQDERFDAYTKRA